MSNDSGVSGGRGPGRARWWMVAVITVAGLGLIGFLTSGPAVEPDEEVAAPSTLPEPTSTATSPPTTSESPTTTTTPGYDPFTIDGTGSETFDFQVPDNLATVLHITHDGESEFTVRTFGADDELIETLLDTVGDYDGSIAINLILGDIVSSIQVVSEGTWTITASYLGDLERHVDEASGRGDAVLIMDLTAPAMTISHDGDSDFSVFFWSFETQGYLINETGPVKSTVNVPVGGVIIEIRADGKWTLSTRG